MRPRGHKLASLVLLEHCVCSPHFYSFPLILAEEKLKGEVVQLFEKTKRLNCDVFDCVETLKRKEYGEYYKQKESLLERITPVVSVSFRTVR